MTMKALKKAYQMAKLTAKLTVKAVQVTVKVAVAIVKAIIAAIEALAAAIAAGGWIAVIIIVVICLIALIIFSIYGIFFSSEDGVSEVTMSSVISEINTEYVNKITEIQNKNDYDDYEIDSGRTEWKDVLCIYTACISGGAETADVITLDETKVNKLKSIFWDMNTITYQVKEEEKEVEKTDENGNIKNEKEKRKVLYIKVIGKTIDDMMLQYNFTEKQRTQVAELQKEEYKSLWAGVIYGSSNGSTDIVEVAIAQLGNVGGQPYWSWYGFSSRVEWCACFVSWCANECGYIEAGVIPKFAGCKNGIDWFKTCGIWQEKGYIPKARRYYIF